jgi:hypothetical protein
MPDNIVELVTTNMREMREKRREKRKRVEVLFVAAVMSMIAH